MGPCIKTCGLGAREPALAETCGSIFLFVMASKWKLGKADRVAVELKAEEAKKEAADAGKSAADVKKAVAAAVAAEETRLKQMKMDAHAVKKRKSGGKPSDEANVEVAAAAPDVSNDAYYTAKLKAITNILSHDKFKGLVNLNPLPINKEDADGKPTGIQAIAKKRIL